VAPPVARARHRVCNDATSVLGRAVGTRNGRNTGSYVQEAASRGNGDFSDFTAEEVGFEPTVPGTGTPVFETGPFNHSGTPPSFARANPAVVYEKLDDPERIL
jgi:hypothetical protein